MMLRGNRIENFEHFTNQNFRKSFITFSWNQLFSNSTVIWKQNMSFKKDKF